MNKQTLSQFFDNLDLWSHTIITQSLLGKLFIFLKEKIHLNTSSFIKKILLTWLLIAISVLFVSLSLPQFANDRFGIGIIILICFFIYLANVFLGNLSKIRFNSIDLLLLAFIFTAFISTFSSYFLKESIIGLLKYLILFACYFMLKTILINCSKKTFLALWSGLFICGVLTALIGVYQYIVGVEPLATWEDPNIENIHTRVYSTLGNPNLLAGYLLLIFPIGLTLPFESGKNLFFKLLFFIGSIIVFICMVFTGSRGGYIGLASEIILGTIILLMHLAKGRNKTITVLIYLILLTGFYFSLTLMFPVISERIATIFTLREHSSNSYRLNVWLSCLNMLKDNWLIGIGAGNSVFREVYGLYMVSGFDALASYNIFLEIAVETGIIGLLLFGLIFLTSFLKLHYMFWNKEKIFALGIVIALVGLLTHGMVDTVFFRPQIFIPFWFLLASIGKLDIEA